MPVGGQPTRAADSKHGVSPEEMQERKQRVLTQGTPAIVRSIADAVVIKDENIFFLTEPDGSIPIGDDHGFGLYYHDCRFLNGYELHLAGTKPQPLVSTAERGFLAVFQLTNPDLRMADGQLIRKEQVGVKWERVIDRSRSTRESAGPGLNDLGRVTARRRDPAGTRASTGLGLRRGRHAAFRCTVGWRTHPDSHG
jgi:hypothetical protein